jgi:starch synthase (maltosyl-transferring)
LIADVNRIRREHPALQHFNVRFLDTENEALIAYARRHDGDLVLVVVCLDPHGTQEGVCVVPADLGLAPSFEVEDELSGERFWWQIGRNYVRLTPGVQPAHVLAVVQP